MEAVEIAARSILEVLDVLFEPHLRRLNVAQRRCYRLEIGINRPFGLADFPYRLNLQNLDDFLKKDYRQSVDKLYYEVEKAVAHVQRFLSANETVIGRKVRFFGSE